MEDKETQQLDLSKFDLEKAWQTYLELGGLKEELLHETQRVETKRAFFGGLATMFFMQIDDMPSYGDSEEHIFKILDYLRQQLSGFWKSQTQSHDKGTRKPNS